MSGETSDQAGETTAERRDGRDDSTQSREPLSVEELWVRRAPGFEAEELHLEALSPGVTVVHGPNASGKTTTARAIQWLLWPETAPDGAEVVGRFSLDGADWRVRVDRGRAEYQRDGQDVGAPNLPPAEHCDRYHLALHDLLQHDARGAGFADAVERQSAGGYDLGAARDELEFDDSPVRRNKGEVQTVEAALEDWRDAQTELRDLEAEQERLPQLEARLDAAREARQRVGLLEQAIDYAQARDELAEAEARLAEFPREVEQLDGDELATVEALETEIGEQEERLRAAQADLQAAEQELVDVALPESGLPAGLLDGLQQRLDRLDGLEQREHDLASSLEAAEARRTKARRDVPLDVGDGDLAGLEPDAWPELWAFARTAEELEHERSLQQTVDRWLGDDGRADVGRDDPDVETLQRGRRALEAWLANPPADVADGASAARRVGAVAGAVLGAVGVALGVVADVAYLALLLVGSLLLWYGHTAADDDGDDRRATYRDDFAQLGIEAPPEWTEATVHDRLTGLYDAIAAHRLEEMRADTRATLLEDCQQLEEHEEALERRRQRLREHLGAAPGATDLELVATAKALLHWQECDAEVRELREEVDAVRDQVDATVDALAADLEPYGYDGVADAATATEYVRDLEDRGRRHEDAVEQRARAEDDVEAAETALAELRSERAAVFADADLQPGDHDRLRELCERVEAYEDARGELRDARTLAESELSALRDLPGHEPDLEERAVADLRAEQREAETTAESYEELQAEISDLEATIDAARRDDEVETARAAVERALDDLEAQLRDDAAAMVGDVLVEHCRDATIEATRPAVFERARELLARITRGRYRLDLSEDATAFRAYDTVRERGYALEDCSSGTQLQVLLAVRLAFVEYHERGHRLPLLLDETLANSDDERARVVVDAVTELARAGRQVVYFTAQGDEVAKWRAALSSEDAEPSVAAAQSADGDGSGDGVEYAEIDLAERRGLEEHVRVPDLDATVESRASPPDPAAHDHASYRDALDVPPFDPRLGAGRAHCWYLLDDVDVLARLLDLGVERWGQLETLLDRGLGHLVADDAEGGGVLAQRGRALETFAECWRRGRGERVTRDALEETDAVTENFVEEVTELARSLDGDARRILEGLRNNEVDRFRSNKIEELETYFEDHGYLDPVDPLDPEEIRVRVIATLVEQGLDRDEATVEVEALLSRLERSDASA